MKSFKKRPIIFRPFRLVIEEAGAQYKICFLGLGQDDVQAIADRAVSIRTKIV